MRIFLSYASQDRAVVEPIRYALAQQGHDIFFDREDLPPGEAFDARIRSAIESSELLICLLSPDTVDAGSYTLTEVRIAQRTWPRASGRVLPVVLRPLAFETIPAYLRSVTLLEPVGNVAASVADAVHQIAQARRRRRVRRVALWTAALLPIAATLGWSLWRFTPSSVDRAPQVLIDAGVFTMGDGEFSPARTVYVSPFYIDVLEVTTARYAEFMLANGSLAPPDGWDSVKLELQGQLPVIGVSWRDAQAYCRWAGKRLPTEAEWEKAARDGDARTYPWGENPPTPELATYGRSAEDPYQGGLTRVGAHPAGSSRSGTQDLAGNVSEWVSDWYSESFRTDDVRDPTGPTQGSGRVIRGGGWLDPPERLQSSRRYFASEDHRAGDVGFRCAGDVTGR